MPATAYLNLIATHLNAPYGAVVRPQDVAAAFRTGNLDSVFASDLAKELLATMFVELSPEIVGRACFEAGVRLEEAQALYEHVRKEWDGPRSLTWEEALEGVL
ncbi:hypothetical protein CAL15_13975 [Bordetella genomosp. 13]|uniref:Uncharacterized protein n=2 Tax=Bordetella genomosp. 13 TaxID=463040 RepID=A0A1W6ZDD1_9BORD|nr:hypothetical protein CAL15_13975 [Bordetella genomosp. 13]